MSDSFDNFEANFGRWTSKDLQFGPDCRGDWALFIERFRINGWDIDAEAAASAARADGPVFFRVLDQGIEQGSHGFIEDGRIVQWG
jgi:hypothetical protein